MKPWQFKIFEKLLDESQPDSIGEIGTHNGKTASQIVMYLLSTTDRNITYSGYDAFHHIDFKTSFGKEKNGKGPGNIDRAKKLLNKVAKKFPDRFTYTLTEGFTKNTLSEQVFDFVYVDAGHSYDSVLHDWNMIKNSKMVIFDDWMMPGVLQVLKDHVESEHEIEYIRAGEESRGVAVIRNFK